MSVLYTALPPYARALDMTVVDDIDGAPVIAMPFADRVQGRPGFLHGGAISGLLEIAALPVSRKNSPIAAPANGA
jgi:acyl-coenzyme A thioesterase PaaI-like protein